MLACVTSVIIQEVEKENWRIFKFNGTINSAGRSLTIFLCGNNSAQTLYPPPDLIGNLRIIQNFHFIVHIMLNLVFWSKMWPRASVSNYQKWQNIRHINCWRIEGRTAEAVFEEKVVFGDAPTSRINSWPFKPWTRTWQAVCGSCCNGTKWGSMWGNGRLQRCSRI